MVYIWYIYMVRYIISDIKYWLLCLTWCVYVMCMHVCLCVFTCVWQHVCLCVSRHLCVHTCGGLKLMLGDFFNHSPLYLLSQGLSLNMELTNLASLASQLVLEIPFLPPECWYYRQLSYLPGFYMSSKHQNSNPHACGTSDVSTEQSPHP